MNSTTPTKNCFCVSVLSICEFCFFGGREVYDGFVIVYLLWHLISSLYLLAITMNGDSRLLILFQKQNRRLIVQIKLAMFHSVLNIRSMNTKGNKIEEHLKMYFHSLPEIILNKNYAVKKQIYTLQVVFFYWSFIEIKEDIVVLVVEYKFEIFLRCLFYVLLSDLVTLFTNINVGHNLS